MVLIEVFIGAFLQALLQQLTSLESLNWLVCGDGLRTKLNKWKDTLQIIEEVLGDATEKQRTDRAVKVWLDDLRDLAYDVLDILEIATEASVAENQASTNKVWKLIRACHIPLVNTNIYLWLKVQKITARFKDIMKRKNELRLIENVERRIRWTSSTSLVDEGCVYGRERDKEAILELVLSERYNNDAGPGVIPIDGMGGVGKTTVAQLVINDERVKGHFDVRVWAHGSDDFDVLELTKTIFTCVIYDTIGDNDIELLKFVRDSNNLNLLQLELEKQLIEKTFLVILDNVRAHKYKDWNQLCTPFLKGTPRCRFVITTRDREVSSKMGTVPACHLEVLSDDACLSVLILHALRERDFSAADPYLAFIGGRICREMCKGLPLAAKTYGGLLRSNEEPDPRKWEEVSNRRILDAPEERDEILSDLMWSYDDLPLPVKRCFEHCSLLPEGYKFEEKLLVRLWMAEGLIQPEREDLGSKCFQELVKKSFFQKSSNGESRFMMHDSINCLAQWVARGTYFRMDDGSDQENRKKARHFSYLCNHGNCPHNFEALSELTVRLRTFLPLVPPNQGGCHCNCNFPLPLLLKFRRLRVLSLSGYHIPELPGSIGDLKLLRYLDLSNTGINSLGRPITTLYNLQTLILENCHNLRRFPSKFENLVKLSYLNIRGTCLPEEIPRANGCIKLFILR